MLKTHAIALHRHLRPGTIRVVSAERLIALEAALMDLGTLYAAGKTFTALHAAAEAELLPALVELGAGLRGLLRAARLSDDEVDRASREILQLRTLWRAKMEAVRASALYQQALTAWTAGDQPALEHLIPSIFAGVRPVHPIPAVFFPVSPSRGRRRPGAAPFLSASDCADRIAHLLSVGIEPDSGGSEWWERELPFVMCADTLAALATPIALHWPVPEPTVALFAVADEPTYRIFTPRVRALLGVVLAVDATDEWWQAYDESYESFRDSLRYELSTRGLVVDLA